jgi:hypothetical protein
MLIRVRAPPASVRGSAALAARPAQHDVVPCDGVAAALLDITEHALEPLVGERLDAAAVVADDVMVVLDRVAHRLEPRHAVSEVDALGQPLLRELVENAVHAGEPDPLAAGNQLTMDLLRSDTAVLRVQELDHACASQPAPVPRCPELRESLL